MSSEPLPVDVPGRSRLLRELRILDSAPEACFDLVVSLLQRQLGVAMAALVFVDDTRAWLKSSTGLPLTEFPRAGSFADLTLNHDGLFEVPDAGLDARFSTHPLVSGPEGLRFYAGLPLTLESEPICVLCVSDPAPRSLDEAARRILLDTGALMLALLIDRLKTCRMRLHIARLRGASLSSSDWLWESNAEGQITWVSDSVEAHTGLTPTASVGLTAGQINTHSAQDHTDSWNRYREARARREPFKELIADRELPNGRKITTSVSGVPVFDSSGRFRGYRGATTDVTARNVAQKAAREAEQLLSDALETLIAGVMISDPNGLVIRSNAVWRRGNTAAPEPGIESWPALVRQMVFDGQYPDAVGREEEFIGWRLSLASDTGTQHELRWRDRWLLVSSQRLSSGNMVHVSIDITDRKETELKLAAQQVALQDSRQRLSAVLEAVPDLWFVLDDEGRYLECSSPDHPMLVHPWESLRGQRFEHGVSGPVAAAALSTLQLALETGRVQRHEYALKTSDGVARWFEARVSPMPGRRLLYVTRDLTEIRALERELMIMKRAVEAAAALPLCVTDAAAPDTPIVYVNPAFETLTGYARHEMLGRNCRVLQGEFTDQPGLTVLRDALRNQRECSVVLDNVRKNGVRFTNSLHVAPVFNASVQLTHYIGVLHDVTEQTRAAEKLRLSEELYRSVALAISDGLMVVTPVLKVVAINPAAASVLGVTQDMLEGSSAVWPFEFLNAQAEPLLADAHPVRWVVQTGAPLVDAVYALRRPDGNIRWLELNAHPLQLRPEGSTFSVVLTFRDVTRQRASEQALVAAEERWKFALESSGDGVWDWDTQTNKVFYSPRWKSMMGYAEDEITESVEEWTSRIHPDDLHQVMAGLRRHLSGETPFYQSEHRVRHRDGTDRWILDRAKAVGHDNLGQPLRVVGTHSDITTAKQAEQALRDKRAAQLANEAKTQFLSRMSHEMRTPLNAVIGFAQLMRMSPGSADGSEIATYTDHVLNAGQHLLALINDVLDLQKVEEGVMSLTIGAVSLDDTVHRTLELLSPLAQSRQVRFSNQMPAGLWVRADAQRLRQVVLNIASNAVKYNHLGGTVRFSADTGIHGRVILTIEDSGSGMNAAQMSRLFQPFERLGKETSSIEGTGLGLIIARSLTQAIGGRLEVSSLPGKGTRVHIELQRSDAPDLLSDNLPLPSESTDTVSSESPPLRMLYVEDNRINAILFEGALRMHNSSVELRVAEDGEEALAIAREWSPEVLVLDAHLPGMSGFDVLRELRVMPGLATVPAYMCSADAMPEDVQRAYEAGFIGYWTKPIDIAAILKDIDDLAQRLRSKASA
ncbi:MAG: hypothetical protein RLZZ618_267 [Pseudomonadota bacterium]|jgi:PAS domain S-box-containing protein